ncbi:MAG: hypothetical protein R6U44_00645 [Archaeoglobaceae archaeon]
MKMEFLSKLFGSKNPVESMNIEELKEMEIKLNNKSDNLQKEVNEIENEIQVLFEKAREAKTKSEEQSFARKIKTLSQKKDMKLSAQGQLEKELRAVSNVLILKDHKSDLKSAGVWDKISKLKPEELENWLISKNLEARDRHDLVSSVVEMTSSAMNTGEEPDDDLEDILDTIRSVKKGDMEPDEAREKVSKEQEE